MRRFLRVLSIVLVLAMTMSLCSCVIKTEAQKSEEASQSEADLFGKTYEVLYGCIGISFTDAIGRLESHFGIKFDLVNYSDCFYYDDENGYCEYHFTKNVQISGIDFNEIRIFCTLDEVVFHVGFVSDADPAGKLDEDYGHIVASCTSLLGQPKTVRNALKDEDVAFTEYGLGDRLVISAGRFMSSEYNSLWFDINDWKLTEELGIA